MTGEIMESAVNEVATEGKHKLNCADGVPLLPVGGDVARHESRGRSRKTMDLAGY